MRGQRTPPESEAIRGVLFYPAAANSCLYVRASVSLTAAATETTDICVRARVCLFDSGGGLSRGVGGRLHSYDSDGTESKSARLYKGEFDNSTCGRMVRYLRRRLR